MNPSKKSIDFIIDEETGGKDYYEKHIKCTAEWPGGASGVTIGVGVDCGYYSSEELTKMMGPYVTKDALSLILSCKGLKGEAAKQHLPKVKGKIIVNWDIAGKIFESFTLPKFMKLAESTFPGVNELHPDAQGAILSIVFNRGTKLTGESRREMAEIRKLVPIKDYKGIASQIRSMKRLWSSTSGLYSRREGEAKLVENAT